MLTVSRAVAETTAPACGTRFAVKLYPKDKEYRRLKLSSAVCTALCEHIVDNNLNRTDLLFPFALLDDDTARTPADATTHGNKEEVTEAPGEPNPTTADGPTRMAP